MPATHIRIAAKHGQLVLTADNPFDPNEKPGLDNSSWIYYSCSARVISEGVVLVPAQELLDFISNLQGGRVEICSDEVSQRVNIEARNRQISLPTSPLVTRIFARLLEAEVSPYDLQFGNFVRINQLVLAKALRESASGEFDVILVNFIEDKLHIGNSVCEVSKPPEHPETFRFYLNSLVANLLLLQLVNDVDVTFSVFKQYQFSILFENPGEDSYFIHWYTCP